MTESLHPCLGWDVRRDVKVTVNDKYILFDLGQNRVEIDLNCLIPNLLYGGWEDIMHISLVAVFFLIFRLVIERAVHCGV